MSEIKIDSTVLNSLLSIKQDNSTLRSKAVSHDRLISQLLDKIEKVDFQDLAFPEYKKLSKELEDLTAQVTHSDGSQNKDQEVAERIKTLNRMLSKMKVTSKIYIVLIVKEVLKLAKANDWGLCRSDDFIYLYNGAFWNLFDKDQIATFLSNAAKEMGVEKIDAEHYKFANELFSQFHFAGNLPKPIQDNATTLINLQNGTYEVSGKLRKLREPKAEDFLKYELPFPFDENAKAPLWESFLNRVLPGIESQNLLAEYLGYLFTHELKLEKALFLYGSGANGKSVVYEVVNALLGKENVSNYSLQSLTDTSGYFRANLANKLVNYASEINGTLESSFFKQLASGEPVEARLPYGNPFILTNYAKLIFNGNTLPTNVEHTNAFFRRFLIIPFEVTIPESEQDKELPNKIIENELAGVFNWVLKGLERILIQRRFSKCDAAEKMVQGYRIQSDTVALFIEDHGYKTNMDTYTPLREIHQEYKAYCIDNGYKSVSNRTLAERLRNLNFHTDTRNIGIVVWITR